ncbi:MAG TPA: hypothetical protein VMN82_06745 [Thermoanaerobaculia bacterium]|nr:hypothetical protein [Thermoanaerobaculia bacterium]
MTLRTGLRRLVFAAALAFALAPEAARAYEEKSLLTSDGTLHVLRTGTAVDLGVTDAGISAQQTLVEWTARGQDGAVSMAILPDTLSYMNKRGLALSYDEETATLLALWTEDVAPFSQIHVAVLHGGAWTNSMLLPSAGISRAYNPEMLITHRVATYLDENSQPVTKTSSILSIVWWEQATQQQARFAVLFLDETNFDPTALTIYDMPTLVGSTGDSTSVGLTTGAYMYPSLQADGLSGSVLVAFADLRDQKFKVVRVDFPTDWGQPSDPNSVNWKRRHIPIVGVSTEGPVAHSTPDVADTRDGVRTTIGQGYRPTLSWADADGSNLRYTRLNGSDWAPVRSIAIDSTTTADQAAALVSAMATRD